MGIGLWNFAGPRYVFDVEFLCIGLEFLLGSLSDGVSSTPLVVLGRY